MQTDKMLTSAVAIVAAVISQTAAAQDGSTAGEEAGVAVQSTENEAETNDGPAAGELSVITVTAERRAGNQQDVPIAITAVSETQLTQAGIEDILDIKRLVPSLNISNTFGTVSTSLRGVGSTAINAGFENPVALYVDGVYLASGRSFLNLANVQQIEVLKGPQGTLFGRNATAGLVQVTTRNPVGAPLVRGELTYANYDTKKLNFYAGGSITDTVALDIAVSGYRQGEGWGDNLTTGGDTYRTFYDDVVRSKLVVTPGTGTEITIIGDYNRRNITMGRTGFPGSSASGIPVPQGMDPLPPFEDTGYDVLEDFPNRMKTWAWGLSATIEQEINDLTLTSITAYRKQNVDFSFDLDLTGEPLQFSTFEQPDEQFSQEILLSSDSGGRLTWVLGGYYFWSTSGWTPINLSFGGIDTSLTISNRVGAESFAGFAQGTYAIGDNTNLTLGGRYTTEERRDFDGSLIVTTISTGNAFTIPGPDNEARFNKFTYRISLDHRFSPSFLAYASHNRGFKSGGFNTSQIASDPYAPETLDATEIGIKTDLFDRTVRFNAAAFYYDYTNVQGQEQVPGGAIQIVNAGSARVYGLDFDFEWLVTDDFRLSGGGAFVDAEYRRYDNALIGNTTGEPIVFGSVRGNQLPLSSDVTFNVNADYNIDLAGGSELNFNANVYYSGGLYFEPDNRIYQPAYAIVGAYARWTAPNGRFYVSAFGRNLTDKRVINFVSTTGDALNQTSYDAPRTYGVAVGFEF